MTKTKVEYAIEWRPLKSKRWRKDGPPDTFKCTLSHFELYKRAKIKEFKFRMIRITTQTTEGIMK